MLKNILLVLSFAGLSGFANADCIESLLQAGHPLQLNKASVELLAFAARSPADALVSGTIVVMPDAEHPGDQYMVRVLEAVGLTLRQLKPYTFIYEGTLENVLKATKYKEVKYITMSERLRSGI